MRCVSQSVPEGKAMVLFSCRNTFSSYSSHIFLLPLQRNQLTKHRPIHDNTQFICPYCPNAKSVKAKSTMQKHLRAVHEDRIEEWKAPGFVNALLAQVDGSAVGAKVPVTTAAATASSSLSSAPASVVSDPADTNNNLDRMLGLANAASSGSTASSNKHKLNSDPMSPPSIAAKRFRADHSSISSSTTSPTMLQQQQPQPHMQGPGPGPLFGRHQTASYNGGSNTSAAGSSSFMIFGAENGSSSSNVTNNNHSSMNNNHHSSTIGSNSLPTSPPTNKHPEHPTIERYHHRTLDSLEIVDNANGGQLQVIGGNNQPPPTATASVAITNGGGGSMMTAGQAGWLTGPVLVNGIAGGGIVVAGDGSTGSTAADGAAEAAITGGAVSGSYDNFYEDYMVL